MPDINFHVRFHDAHERSGKTIYRVVKDTGLARNTIRRFIDPEGAIVKRIDVAVVILAEYYGVDWKSPEVVEVIEEEIEDPKKNKAPLIA